MIRYESSAEGVAAVDLAPFFEGWPMPPSPDRRLAALRGADHVALAFEGERLVGLATALSDGAITAALTLLEVVPDLQGRGIGSELVARLRAATSDLYGLDVCCDDELVAFYRRAGFHRVNGMITRSRAALP